MSLWSRTTRYKIESLTKHIAHVIADRLAEAMNPDGKDRNFAASLKTLRMAIRMNYPDVRLMCIEALSQWENFQVYVCQGQTKDT